MKKVNLVGRVFGRITVLEEESTRRCNKIMWACLCSCGTHFSVSGGSLNSGNTTSCGCAKIEGLVSRVKTHGMSRTRTYTAWCGMINRCENTLDVRYYRYGGRGIFVCKRWRESFENFFSDMGESPLGMTIDRIDNDNGYSPDNCRWATYSQQAKNTSRTRNITANGQTLCISEWAKKIGVSEATIRCRIDRFNWEPFKAVSTQTK